MDDWKNIRTWSARRDDEARGALSTLKGSDGGLPDSKLPECRRKLYAVIGFQPPMSESAAVTSPVGAGCLGDAGDLDRGGVQPRLLQGKARQGPADAQPRHQRDLHRHDRPLALRVERGRRRWSTSTSSPTT